MPLEFFDGSNYGTIEQIQQGGQVIQEVRYWTGSEYVTVFLPIGTVDDFEHNDIQGFYSDPSGTGTVDTTSAAAYNGDWGAHFDGERRIWSQPGDGLDTYYELGEWVEFWFRPLVTSGDTQYWFAFGDGATNDWENHYEIQAIMNTDSFRVQRREGGSTTLLMDDGTTINWSTQWYRVAFKADDQANEIRCRLYEDSGNNRLENLQHNEDPTRGGSWSWPAKHGLRCSSNGEMYADEIQHNSQEADVS